MFLTHWERVMHICVTKLAIVDSGNGLSSGWCQCWDLVNWTLTNKLQWNFNWNEYIFTQESAIENVIWKMVTILSRPQCVNITAIFAGAKGLSELETHCFTVVKQFICILCMLYMPWKIVPESIHTVKMDCWVGLWGFLWWAPSAKRKDHEGVSSGWSSVWHRSNTGLSSTQYEQIPIILVVWPFWLTLFFFQSITFWRAYG